MENRQHGGQSLLSKISMWSRIPTGALCTSTQFLECKNREPCTALHSAGAYDVEQDLMHEVTDPQSRTDVLIVGAGPTGLALATQLARFGVDLRLVDKALDRARESRALGVQARSLELLQSVGLGERLAQRGNTTTRLMLHLDRGEPVLIDLGNFDRPDT